MRLILILIAGPQPTSQEIGFITQHWLALEYLGFSRCNKLIQVINGRVSLDSPSSNHEERRIRPLCVLNAIIFNASHIVGHRRSFKQHHWIKCYISNQLVYIDIGNISGLGRASKVRHSPVRFGPCRNLLLARAAMMFVRLLCKEPARIDHATDNKQW